jgi:uncharacterized protein YxeA
MKTKLVVIVVIILIVAGGTAFYFLSRPKIDIRLVDNLNKLVTFQFKGKEITYKLGSTAMGYSAGSNYSVEVSSVNATGTTPGISIVAKKNGAIFQQKNIYF